MQGMSVSAPETASSSLRVDAAAVEVFIGNQTSVNTQKAYRYDLNKWFNWLGGYEIMPTLQIVVDFRAYLSETFKSRTAARIFNTIRAFYRFLGGWNPFGNIKSPKRLVNATPKVPSDLLVMKMLEICDIPRDKFILTLLLNGLRRAEVANLKSDAVEWLPAYGCDIIRVLGKGNKERLVPANRETSLALRAYKVPDGPFMFPKGTSPITFRTVEYISEVWSEKAGKKTGPHAWRHHYATRLVRAKSPILSVSKLLGHESVATTSVYITLDMDDIVSAARLDPLDKVIVDETKLET